MRPGCLLLLPAYFALLDLQKPSLCVALPRAMRSRVYAAVATARLLLWARPARRYRSTAARQRGERMRAVSRCQRTQEAEHRLVSYRPYCNDRRIQRVSAETEVTSFLAANMSDIYCIDVKTLKKNKKNVKNVKNLTKTLVNVTKKTLPLLSVVQLKKWSSRQLGICHSV